MVSSTSSGKKRGRPKKNFDESSDRSKRRKAALLKETASTNELLHAARLALKSDGCKTSAQLVKNIQFKPPETVNEIFEAWNELKKSQPSTYTPEEALSLLITNNFTKEQYLALRKGALDHGFDMYPSYDRVLAAKKEAYPPGIVITETKCEVPLQSLLHHTSERIMQHLELSSVAPQDNIELELICKVV